MEGVTNEKVKFVETSTLDTNYYEENQSQTAVHRCFTGKLILKISEKTRSPSKIRPLNFEKK